MIKYEIKKNLIYNKGWVLVLFVILQLLIGHIFRYQPANNLESQNYQYYYNHLQGKITDDKIDFINYEEKCINEFDEKKELIEKQYKNDEISDEKYVESLEELNTYHYRASVFENVKEYVSYVQTDTNREYINEDHMDSYLKSPVPYILIVVIILNIVISFQNEESMYLLTKTTLIGKRKLIKTKIIALISINSIIYILYFLINFLLKYKFNYIPELFVQLDSTRMFEGTFFQGNIFTMIMILFLLQWLGVIFLSFISSLLCLKIRISSLKLCILEIGTFIISFILFINTKWIYYILPIGFFNPIRYFLGESIPGSEVNIQSFGINDLVIIIVISFITIMFMVKKRVKLLKIPTFLIMAILLSSCQSEKIVLNDVKYSNSNGFNCNEEVAIFTIDNQLLDFRTDKKYQINRNPLKNIKMINIGYMYYQYFYYIETSETEWSLQRLNTENFEQIEIHRSSLYKYDILGNITSSPRFNTPQQIYVNDEDVYVVFENRVEIISPHHSIESLFEKHVFILKLEQENIYYINDKNQLETFNMKTCNYTICVDTLISNAYIDDQYIYYTKLKNENLYRLDRNHNVDELVIDESINFFQIIDNKIYYTIAGGKGINVYSYESGKREIILNDYIIYAFSILDNKIMFTAYDNKLDKISNYYLNNDTVYKIGDIK